MIHAETFNASGLNNLYFSQFDGLGDNRVKGDFSYVMVDVCLLVLDILHIRTVRSKEKDTGNPAVYDSLAEIGLRIPPQHDF